MCKFCDGKEVLEDNKWGTLTLSLRGKDVGVTYDAYSCDSSINEDKMFIFNYCPICGRKLNDK